MDILRTQQHILYRKWAKMLYSLFCLRDSQLFWLCVSLDALPPTCISRWITANNEYLFEQLKSLNWYVLCSRSIGMPFKWPGLSSIQNSEIFSHLNNCCYIYMLSIWKQFSSLPMAKVFHFRIHNYSPFWAAAVPCMAQGISVFVMLKICLTVTLLSQRTSFFIGVYFKGIAIQMSRYLFFLSIHCSKIEEQDTKINIFAWLYRTSKDIILFWMKH